MFNLEKTTTLLATHSLSLLLHNLANLHGRIEELGGAAIEADGFTLVELAFAVISRDTLLLARLLEAKVGLVLRFEVCALGKGE